MSSDKKDEERKKGAVPFWLRRAGGAAASASTAPAAVGPLLLIATLCGGTYVLNRVTGGAERPPVALTPPPAAADGAGEAETPTGILSDEKPSGSSLNMVSTGRMDKTNAELQAELAAAKAENDTLKAQLAGKGEGADEGAGGGAAAGGKTDWASVLGSARQQGQGASGPPNGSWFTGQLDGKSSAFQGSAAGAAGAGGGAAAGRQGGGGKLRPFSGHAKARSSAVSSRGLADRFGSGLANRQLSRAFQTSAAARSSGVNETMAVKAGQGFDNTTTPGSVILGPGVELGNNGAPTGGGYTSNGNSNTSNNNNTSVNCDLLFPNQGYIYSPGVGCVPPVQGHMALNPAQLLHRYQNWLRNVLLTAISLQLLIGTVLIPYYNARKDYARVAALGTVGLYAGGMMTVLGGLLAMIAYYLRHKQNLQETAVMMTLGSVAVLLSWFPDSWIINNTTDTVRHKMRDAKDILGRVAGDLNKFKGKHYNPATGQWEHHN